MRGPVQKALQDAKLKASDIDEVVLVGGSTRMPRVQQIVKEIFGKEPHKGVNPDEVVAVGAAIQGAVLAGDVKGVLLLDVTPLSLGLETKGGVFTKLVPAEHDHPHREEGDLHYRRGQPVGRDDQGLPGRTARWPPTTACSASSTSRASRRPRWACPQIEVSFNIDANGILQVSARDKGTGKEQTIKIESSGGLTKEEIDRMQRDAQAHAAEDKHRRELAEARNAAEQRVYQLEKLHEREQGPAIGGRHRSRPQRHRHGQPGESRRRPGRDSASDRGPPAGKPGDVRTPLRRVRRSGKLRGSQRLGAFRG